MWWVHFTGWDAAFRVYGLRDSSPVHSMGEDMNDCGRGHSSGSSTGGWLIAPMDISVQVTAK
jgi:hypothetical protein